jgi:hypothetical protein
MATLRSQRKVPGIPRNPGKSEENWPAGIPSRHPKNNQKILVKSGPQQPQEIPINPKIKKSKKQDTSSGPNGAIFSVGKVSKNQESPSEMIGLMNFSCTLWVSLGFLGFSGGFGGDPWSSWVLKFCV